LNKLAVVLKREEAYTSSYLTFEFIVVEVFAYLGCDAGEVGLVADISRQSIGSTFKLLDSSILEEGNDRMSRKAGNQPST
jgi:hypothetical protein